VTAASLFDGHDAAINIIRRLLQSSGAEVIHLGHNRAVRDVVTTALQEDANAVAVSSYQGGHMEYFRYLVAMLREQEGADIKVFGGGGGVIVPDEVARLHACGVARLYSPQDGQRIGLQGIIDDMLERATTRIGEAGAPSVEQLQGGNRRALARVITALENGTLAPEFRARILELAAAQAGPPVVGITGTGGAGKSSLTDELIRRFRLDYQNRLRIAVLAIDPSRRKSGGALLGDRIRMNAIDSSTIYMRSLATRGSGFEVPTALADIVAATRIAGFNLIVIETSGIGQGDAAIVPHADVALYVMTPEFGAASQLEKIDMLDFADLIAINKFDRRGGRDAQRDVSKQLQRNRQAFSTPVDELPVYGTIASRFNDDGVTALYQGLVRALRGKGAVDWGEGKLPPVSVMGSSRQTVVVAPARQRYLAEIAETVRGYHQTVRAQTTLARERQQLREAKRMLEEEGQDGADLDALIARRHAALDPRARKLLDLWPKVKQSYAGDEYVVKIRHRGGIGFAKSRHTLHGTTRSGDFELKLSVCRSPSASLGQREL
jgi:methylmalonyl-CoA mutase